MTDRSAPTDRDLALLIDRNTIGAFAVVAAAVGGSGGRRAFGTVEAVATGLPSANFNLAFARSDSAVPDLEAAVEWLAALGVPHQAQLHLGGDPALVDAVRRQGLVEDDWPVPGMVLAPVPAAGPPLPDGLRIASVKVGQPDGLRDYLRAVGADSTEPDLLGRVFSRRLLGDPRVEAFVGHLDGRPIATSMTIRTDGVAGIYAVHVAEAVRGRGIGTAMTWRAAAAGVAGEGDVVVLQASRLGHPVYRSMGFRDVVAYRTFSRR